MAVMVVNRLRNKGLPATLVYSGLILNIGLFTFNVLDPFKEYLQNNQICICSHPYQPKNADVCVGENQTFDQYVQIDRQLFNYMVPYLYNTKYPGVKNYTLFAVARLGLRPLPQIEPLIPEYGPVINDVTSYKYPISIPSCRKIADAAKRSVFVVVISSPDNFQMRNVIRQTWRIHLMEERKKDLMLAGFAFFLGQTNNNVTQSKIQEENKIHGDIIQIEMADFYENLPRKVTGLFNWLYRYCSKIDFVLKVDDDVYVNVRNLVHFVQLSPYDNHSDMSMFGVPGFFSPNRGGKWKITQEEWPWNQYPPYLLGPTVLIPGNTIIPLLAAFQTTPMIQFEDLYYTGLCAEKAGIKRRFSSGGTLILSMQLREPLYVPDACKLRNFLAWLTTTGSQMTNMHTIAEQFLYQNKTTCIVPDVDGTNKTISSNQPVRFYFT